MAASKKPKGLSKEEISAMKEYLQEKNAPKEGEGVVLAKIASFPEPDRAIAKRVHAVIRSAAPNLSFRTWYGMPAYMNGEKIICFFQNASKFKVRYQTLGFTDKASIDEGQMWPTTYAIMKLGPAEEAKITALVKKAVR